MAKCKKGNLVLLGFEDEPITDKNKSSVGYWTNKFGGCPDWPVERISSPCCQLCGLSMPLVVQVYAPLENSPFHRILYVFGCINPNCWNQNKSWTCIRTQLFDTEYNGSESPTVTKNSAPTDWGADADNWDDGNGNFENGNIIHPLMNQHSPSDNESDDDSSSLSGAVGNLTVDEANANWGVVEKSYGAVGGLIPPVPTAEIEAEESEVVCVDSPVMPVTDLLSYFEESAPVPSYMELEEWNKNNSVEFVPFFISVGDENHPSHHSEHVRDLMQEYFSHHRHIQGREEPQVDAGGSEDYEKSIPIHGDKMFHRFMSKIQSNPGQILRYSRDCEPPLLLYPLEETPRKCQHCKGDMVFEMQLLPTLIPKCRFPGEEQDRLEFGTVLIFTCKGSCWSYEDKFREEIAVVQKEKIETYPANYLKSVNFN